MKKENVFKLLKSDERFTILAKILETSGIGEAMSNEQETFTFFAPTDLAFGDLSDRALEFLTSDEGRELAAALLSFHVIPKSYLYSSDLRKNDRIENLNGSELEIREEKNILRIGEAHIFTPGITARNGVVFPVDKILRETTSYLS